jgi:hypothetical protein
LRSSGEIALWVREDPIVVQKSESPLRIRVQKLKRVSALMHRVGLQGVQRRKNSLESSKFPSSGETVRCMREDPIGGRGKIFKYLKKGSGGTTFSHVLAKLRVVEFTKTKQRLRPLGF